MKQAFHGCPIFQVGANGIEEEEESNNSAIVTRTCEVRGTLAPLPKLSKAVNCGGEKLIT
jgi:hypothetical protein